MSLRTSRFAALCAAAPLLMSLGGCNILAPLFFIVSGPETFEAEHKLDEQRPTVVFVDDPRSQIPRRALRLEILNAVQDAILRKGLVDDLIEGQAAIRVADSDTSAGQMSVTEVGRALEADVVVWITIDRFIRPSPTGDTQASVTLRVRAVDAESNTLDYPTAPAGRSVTVTDTIRRGTVANAAGARTAAEIDIAKKAGLAAAQLFYEHAVTVHAEDRGL
ncbi:MAG: hypothetical protein AAF937_13190 [Planctomycetota bacterium]